MSYTEWVVSLALFASPLLAFEPEMQEIRSTASAIFLAECRVTPVESASSSARLEEKKPEAKPLQVKPERESYKSYSLKARVSAFLPHDYAMGKIYGKVWPAYALEGNYLINEHLSPFLNTAFYYASGKSLGLKDKTEIFMMPITGGANYFWTATPNLRPFLGVGMGAVYTSFNNHSAYVQRHPHAWGFSLLTQAGMEVSFCNRLFADLFTAYRWQFPHFKKSPGVETTQVQMGGWELGGSIGGRF